MGVITENWSSSPFVRGESATRTFVGTGFTDADDFLASLAASPWSVAVNSQYPLDSRLRATVPQVERLSGNGDYRASVSYIRPEQGSVTERPDDLLDAPPLIQWSKGSEAVPTDVDAMGNPIVNTAYLPFDTQFTTSLNFRILKITINQSAYSVAQALAYEDHVNADTVTIPLSGSVAPGQMLCVSIEPTAAFDEEAEIIPVAYTFHLRKGTRVDEDGVWDAWKYRILNVGRTGWWDDSGTKRPGPFVSPAANNMAGGVIIDSPLVLENDGKPVSRYNAKVAKTADGVAATAVAAPSTVNPLLLERDTTNGVYYLKYYRYKKRIMGDLPVFS